MRTVICALMLLQNLVGCERQSVNKGADAILATNAEKVYELFWMTQDFEGGSALTAGEPKVEGDILTYVDFSTRKKVSVHNFTSLKIEERRPPPKLTKAMEEEMPQKTKGD